MDQLEPNIMRDSMPSTVSGFLYVRVALVVKRVFNLVYTVFCFLNCYVSDLLIFNISSHSRLLIF